MTEEVGLVVGGCIQQVDDIGSLRAIERVRVSRSGSGHMATLLDCQNLTR
jgi:hypothetical protein